MQDKAPGGLHSVEITREQRDEMRAVAAKVREALRTGKDVAGVIERSIGLSSSDSQPSSQPRNSGRKRKPDAQF